MEGVIENSYLGDDYSGEKSCLPTYLTWQRQQKEMKVNSIKLTIFIREKSWNRRFTYCW